MKKRGVNKKTRFDILKDVPEDFEIRVSDENDNEYDFYKLSHVWKPNLFAVINIELF